MDWFLYDNGLRNERVNNENMMEVAQGKNSVNVIEILLNKYINITQREKKLKGRARNVDLLFHDGVPYHIETSPVICRANQWTGFYMIGNSVMK